MGLTAAVGDRIRTNPRPGIEHVAQRHHHARLGWGDPEQGRVATTTQRLPLLVGQIRPCASRTRKGDDPRRTGTDRMDCGGGVSQWCRTCRNGLAARSAMPTVTLRSTLVHEPHIGHSVAL